jgi:hypothetical protein
MSETTTRELVKDAAKQSSSGFLDLYTAITGLSLDDAFDIVEERERGIKYGPSTLKALKTMNDHIKKGE